MRKTQRGLRASVSHVANAPEGCREFMLHCRILGTFRRQLAAFHRRYDE